MGGNPLNAVDPQGLNLVVLANRLVAGGQNLYYRYGPGIAQFINEMSGVNGALVAAAPANPLIAQIPMYASRMTPVAVGIVEAIDTGAFCLAKSANSYIWGYRAVSNAEASDIALHGFRAHPRGLSMEDKWFSESSRGANQLQEIFNLDQVVKAKIPLDVYGRSYKHSNIDNTGPGFCVQCSDLGLIPKP